MELYLRTIYMQFPVHMVNQLTGRLRFRERAGARSAGRERGKEGRVRKEIENAKAVQCCRSMSSD